MFADPRQSVKYYMNIVMNANLALASLLGAMKVVSLPLVYIYICIYIYICMYIYNIYILTNINMYNNNFAPVHTYIHFCDSLSLFFSLSLMLTYTMPCSH